MPYPAPKVAVVCMVYNGTEYISEFLLHHRMLADHVYMIDHNSTIDLRHLQMDRLTVLRTNHEAQFQSEVTNATIEHFKIKENFDWLFVLDIDEFLPFTTRTDFHAFLNAHKNDRVVQFYWRNGVPFYDETSGLPDSLINCTSIRFFHKPSVNFKSGVNIRRTRGCFFVPTGAHHINEILPAWSRYLPFAKKYKIYTPHITDKPLYHVVAFNKSAFLKKIKNYVEQMKYREHIPGQGGWGVRDYPTELSGDQWLWYIANFRVSNPKKFFDMKPEYFIEEHIFAHLNAAEVIALRSQILSGPQTDKKPVDAAEKAYLANKKDDRDVMENIRWFKINPDHEIITVIPSGYAAND